MPWDNDGKNNGPWGQGPQGPKPPFSEKDNIEEFIKKGQERVKNMISGGGQAGGDNKKVIIFFAVVAFLLFLISNIFYVVEEGSEGVVTRFGEFNRKTYSGLNYKFPAPVENVTQVQVDAIRKEEVGFRSGFGNKGTSVLSESLMLTGDENIVDVNVDIQWVVKDSYQYLFNVRDLYGENTIKAAAESAIRYVIGDFNYTDAISGDGRDKITKETKRILQETLDGYKIGVEINSVQIKKIDPPGQVIDAFRDVQTARADKEREINQAQAYRNDNIPKAKGYSEKLIQEAEAYKNEVIASAEGETSRFLAVYDKYQSAKDVTRSRIYLETMEKIMKGTDKIMMDGKAGSGVVPYLPLNELNRKN